MTQPYNEIDPKKIKSDQRTPHFFVKDLKKWFSVSKLEDSILDDVHLSAKWLVERTKKQYPRVEENKTSHLSCAFCRSKVGAFRLHGADKRFCCMRHKKMTSKFPGFDDFDGEEQAKMLLEYKDGPHRVRSLPPTFKDPKFYPCYLNVRPKKGRYSVACQGCSKKFQYPAVMTLAGFWEPLCWMLWWFLDSKFKRPTTETALPDGWMSVVKDGEHVGKMYYYPAPAVQSPHASFAPATANPTASFASAFSGPPSLAVSAAATSPHASFASFVPAANQTASFAPAFSGPPSLAASAPPWVVSAVPGAPPLAAASPLAVSVAVVTPNPSRHRIYHTQASTSVYSAPRRRTRASRPVQPGPVVMPNGEKQWLIDRIVAKREVGGRYQYLVRWLGYGPGYDQWLAPKELRLTVHPILSGRYRRINRIFVYFLVLSDWPDKREVFIVCIYLVA
jgi:hypothetical protein